MKIKCPRCKKINEIKWKIEGYGLISLDIFCRCPNCGHSGVIHIIFPKSKKEKLKTKVEFNDMRYIG